MIGFRSALPILACATVVILPEAYPAEWSLKDRLQEKEQLDMWEHRLLSSKDLPPANSIEELSLGIRSMGYRKAFDGRDPRTDQVYSRIQQVLLAIPGHAEFYRDRINSTRDKLADALRSGDIERIGDIRGDLANEIMYGFQTLEHLPSPETVGVLGEFLFDERGYVDISAPVPSEKELYDAYKDGPVFSKAARALDALPIVSKPSALGASYRNPADTESWREWYREIKSGKRTFRFEGDPVEYDLNGPAPGQKLERIARDQRREADREAGFRKSGAMAKQEHVTEAIKSGAQVWPIFVGLFLGGICLWFAGRRLMGRN